MHIQNNSSIYCDFKADSCCTKTRVRLGHSIVRLSVPADNICMSSVLPHKQSNHSCFYNLITSVIWPRPHCPTLVMEVPAERREQEELELDICGPESQRGPNQDTVQLNTDPSTLTDPVQLRIKQLLNRRLFLLELQCFRKTTHSNGSSAPGECESPRLPCSFSRKAERFSAFQNLMLTFQLWKKYFLVSWK